MSSVLDLKNIKSVEFILENCETVVVPKKNFEYLKLNERMNDCEDLVYELKCKINSLNDIERFPNFDFDTDTGLQRLAKYNDLVAIEVTFNDDSMKKYELIWDYNHSQMTNRFQITKIYNYKILEITVSADNYNENIEKCMMFVGENFNNACNECWCKKQCDRLEKEKRITVCEVFGYILKD